MSAPSSAPSISPVGSTAWTLTVLRTDLFSWLSIVRYRTLIRVRLAIHLIFFLTFSDLERRGCVRTAFEFSRLMYSLDPWNDPHGSLFHLDYLSIKSGMHQWLLDVFDVFTERRSNPEYEQDARLDPTILPGWAYARALAIRMVEDARKNEVLAVLDSNPRGLNY